MSVEEECEALAAYAADLFSDDPCWEAPPLLPLPVEWFAEESWKSALQQLSNHKAVPKRSGSVMGWKQHKWDLAPALRRIAVETVCSASPYIPEHWLKVQLAWLPKPGKAPISPNQLRSVGLMSPDTKAFLMILKQHANPWVQKALAEYPQFAYRSSASTRDPLLRSTLHCATVRKKLAGYVEDHTAKVLQQAKRELLGGLMVSIDLSKAFDLLKYSEMMLALRDTGMPEPLCRILLRVHMQTQLAVEHGGHSRTISMQRGLRQGCCVAPMIYACWTVRLCKVLDTKLGSASSSLSGTWTQNHLSIFADDKHCHWELESVRSFERALADLRVVLHTIVELGMQISIQKSLATIAVKGKKAAHVLRKYTKSWNGQRSLVLREDAHDMHIPLTEEMQYLGVVLSYNNFELATAKRRVQQANITYAQLKPVLRTSGPLSQARRLSVYRTCVWPSLTYGIGSTGITPSVCRLLQSTAAMHLRKVLRIHEKGHSNESVLLQAAIPLLQHLRQQVESQGLTLNCDEGRSPQLRIAEDTRQHQLQEQLLAVQRHGTGATLIPQDPSQVAQIPCPVCGITYATEAGLHQHMHQRHPEVEQASKIRFQRSEHSLFGLPFCRFCRSRQGTWDALIKHVTQGMCLRIKLATSQKQQTIDQLMQEIIDEEYMDPPQLPEGENTQLTSDVRESSLLADILRANIQDLHRHSDQLIQHAKQCYLCGQRLQQASRIKPHWKASHPQAWQQVSYHAITRARSLSALFRRPCRFCGSVAKNTEQHSQQCPVLFQVLAYKQLKATDDSQDAAQSYHMPKPRKSEASAAYKSFVSPLQTALQRGSQAPPSGLQPQLRPQSATTTPIKEALPVRTVASYRRAQAARGTIQQYFTSGCPSLHSADRSAQTIGAPWTCRLKLRNPHAVCYANASVLALLHCVVIGNHSVPELQFLIKVGQKAAEKASTLLLPQMQLFRNLTPAWTFDTEQQDAAEYLHALFSRATRLQAIWDARVRTSEGIRLSTQGSQPVAIPLSNGGGRDSLQTLVETWHQTQDITALAFYAPLVCLQIGRYVEVGKQMNPVDLPDNVVLPVFDELSHVQWLRYRLISAVIHLGRSTRAGHYRAMLKVGSSWVLTDDHKEADSLTLHDGHLRNVYVYIIMLSRDPSPDAADHRNSQE